METLLTRVTVWTRRRWALYYSTTGTLAGNASKSSALIRRIATKARPSPPSPPPISARPTGHRTPITAGGATRPDPTSTWPSLPSWRLLNGRLALYPSCFAGTYIKHHCVLCLFYLQTINLIITKNWLFYVSTS